MFPFDPVYSYGDLSIIEKLRIYFLRNDGFNDVYYNYFSGVLRKHNAIVMECHFGTCGVEFLQVKQNLGLPMVTVFHGADMSLVPCDPEWREKYKTLFGEGELFLAEGTHMKEGLVELGCPEGKIIVQHLGVDLENLPHIPRRIGHDGMVHVLVAGTFREKKGIPYALEAFARVRQKHRNIRLTLLGDSAGQTRDEQEKRRICEVLGRHDLNGSVRWLGYQPHPIFREMLKRHHLFLSPSVTASDGDSEGGYPVSITEALATGMPVISTYHADISEVVVDGKSGLLSPERDIEALAANLDYLVTHSEVWEDMGLRGRDHVAREYNVKVQVRRLEDIYSALLSK